MVKGSPPIKKEEPTHDRSVRDRRRILLYSLLVMGICMTGAVFIAVYSLYQVAIQQRMAGLREMVRGQAQLVRAIGTVGTDPLKPHEPEEGLGEILEVVYDHSAISLNEEPLGVFVLGRLSGEHIEFLMRDRFQKEAESEFVPFEGETAEPMRRALSGESGTMIGLDYRGVWVLSAYEPIKDLGLGLVAKTDLAEVRNPFIKVSLLVFLFSVVLLAGGGWVMVWVNNPLINRLGLALKMVGDQKRALDASAIVAITDAKGKITYANDMFCTISKYTREELLGQDHRILNSGFHTKAFIKGLWQTIKSGQVWHGEIRNCAKDGSYYWVDTTIVPIRDQSGEIDEFVSIRFLIDDRKKMEAELDSYRDRLEHLVEERTIELERTQKELIRSERLSALGRVLGTFSHDLKNPLGTIELSLFSLKESLDGDALPVVQRSLDRALRNTKVCKDMIEHLLQTTRGFELDFQRVDLDSWLESLIEDAYIPQSIQVSCELATGAEVRIDPIQVRRCVSNLLNNSIDALLHQIPHSIQGSDSPPANLSLTARQSENRIEIEVSDSGPGIPESDLEEIFEPLYSTKPGGSGLGLMTVKQVIEKHGGGVEVFSREGEGTRFVMWLPEKVIHRETMKA